MIDFKRCPDGMPCGGSCSPFECRRDTRPAMPESDTPETDALVARWADMAKQPADLTFTQLHDLIEQVVKEILKSHEDLERRLAQAQVKLEEADTALRIRSTECLMQSQRAAQAQTRIAEIEKELETLRVKHGSA